MDKKRKVWKDKISKLSKFTPLLAILIAFLSLTVAIKSCQQSNSALEISEMNFSEERKLAWTGFVNDTLELQLSPSNSEIYFSDVDFFMPRMHNFFKDSSISQNNRNNAIDLLSSTEWENIDNNTFKINLSFVTHLIHDALNYAADHKDINVIGTTIKCPVLINSKFVYRGSRFRDWSLYLIRFTPFYTSAGLDFSYKPDGLTFAGLNISYKPEGITFVRTYKDPYYFERAKKNIDRIYDQDGNPTWLDSTIYFNTLVLDSVSAGPPLKVD